MNLLLWAVIGAAWTAVIYLSLWSDWKSENHSRKGEK